LVVIVDNPDKGIKEDNLIVKSSGKCKHLIGEKSGGYSCTLHNKSWYKETPCWNHGQIEVNIDCECRMGRYLLNKLPE